MRLAILISMLLWATALPAAERWIPIAGTVGVFHTDVRLWNPSSTKDIEVIARLFPTGNVDNSAAAAGGGVTLTVPRRSMQVLDDVTSLFDTTQLGALHFTSTDEFTASSRIYAQSAAGTLGQSFVAESPAAATTKGSVLQLEATPAFRTNIGAVNIAATATSVTWRLHDKSNAEVATATTTMPPYAVIAPTNVLGLFRATGLDLSDAWVSFSATNPIFAYGSVVDNTTNDPTTIPAQRDTGDTPSDRAAITTTGAFFALNVADIDSSVRWYSEKLGLRVVLRSAEGAAIAVLEGGGLIVELLQRPDAVAPGSTPRHGFAKAGMLVDDFNQALAALQARGVPILFGPFPARPDQRANAIFADNAGNLIQIFGQTSAR
jgi:catechol 2,3-dioxygenase-like lactoylglutathione lyase family enzyme